MELKRLEEARKKSKSKYLKADYDRSIKRMRKILLVYDFNQRRKRPEKNCVSCDEFGKECERCEVGEDE